MSKATDVAKEYLKPPFSAYDFFGYLIPAFLFLLCVYLFELSASRFIPNYHQPFRSICELTLPAKDAQLFFQAGYAVGFVLAAYVCGHIIGTISSVLLDRTLVSKAHGYPSERLIGKRESTPRGDASESFYRGFFAWSNIFIWVLVTWAILSAEAIPKWLLAGIVTLTLAPVTFYLILSYFWPTTKEAKRLRPHLRWKWYTYPFNGVLMVLNRYRVVIRKVLRLYAFPYNIAWWLLNGFFDWDEPLSPEIRSHYQQSFFTSFSMDSGSAQTDNYWLSTFYVSENAPGLYQMLRNWFHLYSFARNVATAFYMAFCYGAFYIAFLKLSGAEIQPAGKICFLGTLLAYFILSFLLVIRYYYLYFSYYSKNLFRAFAYVSRTRQHSP